MKSTLNSQRLQTGGFQNTVMFRALVVLRPLGAVRAFSASAARTHGSPFPTSCSLAPSSAHGLAATVRVLGQEYAKDAFTNVTPGIPDKLARRLHANQDHPLGIIKVGARLSRFFSLFYVHAWACCGGAQTRIEQYFRSAQYGGQRPLGAAAFTTFGDLSPVVTAAQNFDSVLVPVDHVSRSRNDNYYVGVGAGTRGAAGAPLIPWPAAWAGRSTRPTCCGPTRARTRSSACAQGSTSS